MPPIQKSNFHSNFHSDITPISFIHLEAYNSVAFRLNFSMDSYRDQLSPEFVAEILQYDNVARGGREGREGRGGRKGREERDGGDPQFSFDEGELYNEMPLKLIEQEVLRLVQKLWISFLYYYTIVMIKHREPRTIS